ncbi:hypothetical protein H0H92_009443 [Tricholoma furcatifolium]|nr:hypothetical protein H0H92_009443 [Tricholoma furcatifolium]
MNFYFEAAKTLDRLDSKEGSIKGVLASLPQKDRKRTTALVIETLKYKTVLTDVIGQSKLLREEKKITSLNLALVLVHDLLLSGGIQAGDGPIKQAVLRHKTRLHGEFQKIKIKRGAKANTELAQTGDQRADEHIPNLLSFSPQVAFQEDPFYKEGKLILQDKASCFPATVLSPPVSDGSFVIDATSAPGNKTSHLSALMQNKGKLFAFERDKKRFKTLTTMLSKAGCRNVEPLNVDFLTIEEEGDLDERLKRLASFQIMMVKHAMRFPGVQKIVYSTCSVHATENEQVVREALKSDEAQAGSFSLASPIEVLPKWHRRGFPEEMEHPAASLLRCLPGDDATNGFFVSCFVRDQGQSTKRKASTDIDEPDSVVPHKKKKKRKKAVE